MKLVGMLLVGLILGVAATALAQGYAADAVCSTWMVLPSSFRLGYTSGALSVLDASPLPQERDTGAQNVGQMQQQAESWCRLYPSMNVAQLMLWVTGYSASAPTY